MTSKPRRRTRNRRKGRFRTWLPFVSRAARKVARQSRDLDMGFSNEVGLEAGIDGA